MKYVPLLILVLALIALVLSFVQPGSGWGFASGAGAVVAGLWLGITKYRTGKFISDSAGGH
ncbi:hypothetical protein QMK33_19660 [Hymenobacter sp. H14-R3]|uniref:hypothetical protein n=1 Tax=Hymenobacter sp. H14-R3 TaxID=3046308 RepID=UPI0024BB725A|nr:hypothetical protein [Hymenobacter sp. H14-R3]MDJ0367371.1 hypothetical protein [Hymenobacter sp. H14-R3]